MARKVIRFTEEEIEKRYREGRGTGDVSSYMPWLTVHDLSSLGLSTRLPSPKTGRLHHLLSAIETGAFMEFILHPSVVDVQEQFPLDREDTRAIALEMGVKHPVYPGTGVDVVMTTDLVVYVQEDGGIRRLARAVKPAAKLADANVLLKLEFERRFWSRRGVDWMIITDLEQSRQRRNGLEWMHSRLAMEPHADPEYWLTRIEAFLVACRNGRNKTFQEIEQGLVLRRLLDRDEMITIVRHLAANGRLAYDPERVFDTTWRVSEMPIIGSEITAHAAGSEATAQAA